MPLILLPNPQFLPEAIWSFLTAIQLVGQRVDTKNTKAIEIVRQDSIDLRKEVPSIQEGSYLGGTRNHRSNNANSFFPTPVYCLNCTAACSQFGCNEYSLTQHHWTIYITGISKLQAALVCFIFLRFSVAIRKKNKIITPTGENYPTFDGQWCMENAYALSSCCFVPV